MPIADFSGRVRPDACPGALQVHEAADGPLARVRLPGGAVSVAQLHELASCAAELGTGVLELTSRANVQVRGLSRPEVFAGRIASVGLLPSPAHERVRNIVASPLSGRGPVGLLDVLAPADALDRALCARPRLAGLPGRFLFALDDGTGDVIGLGADVTFAATGPRDGRLLLAGTDTGLTTGPGSAIPLMIRAAEAFLDERPGDAPRAWRVHELANGPARITARLRGDTPPPASSLPGLRPPAAIGGRRAGRVAQWDGRVAVEAVVPLGRLTPAQARTLADAGHPVRLTPWRTAVLLDLSPPRRTGPRRHSTPRASSPTRTPRGPRSPPAPDVPAARRRSRTCGRTRGAGWRAWRASPGHPSTGPVASGAAVCRAAGSSR
ncbi:precorrin-3B synthase [Nonomuraea antimicrobica]